jgi:hypothetical protein
LSERTFSSSKQGRLLLQTGRLVWVELGRGCSARRATLQGAGWLGGPPRRLVQAAERQDWWAMLVRSMWGAAKGGSIFVLTQGLYLRGRKNMCAGGANVARADREKPRSKFARRVHISEGGRTLARP